MISSISSKKASHPSSVLKSKPSEGGVPISIEAYVIALLSTVARWSSSAGVIPQHLGIVFDHPLATTLAQSAETLGEFITCHALVVIEPSQQQIVAHY